MTSPSPTGTERAHMVYRYRVKSLQGELNRQARAVSFVWNYCNDAQKHARNWGKRWLSGIALTYLTAGSSVELGILADTISQVCLTYASSRKRHRRPWLRYRGRRSLGWVPLKGITVKRHGDDFRVGGKVFRVFCSRPLPEGKIRDGSSFSQDAKGNWFLNVVIEIEVPTPRPIHTAVGIDLGLKDLAALSTGETVPNPRFTDGLAESLAVAQRAHKKRRVAAVNARIVNSRRDGLHKLSRRLVSEFDFIAVGNVNAAGLAQTTLAKSVLDASWSTFREMLRYKAIRHGATFEEVGESYTTQTCSSCGARSGPKGRKDLRIRTWCCSTCGVVHDRDHNAAVNILSRSGHGSLVEGVAFSGDAKPAVAHLPASALLAAFRIEEK